MNKLIRERIHWRTAGSFNTFCHYGFSHDGCTFPGNCEVTNTRSVRDLFLHTSREDTSVPKYWTCLQKKCVHLILPKYRLVMRYLWGNRWNQEHSSEPVWHVHGPGLKPQAHKTSKTK